MPKLKTAADAIKLRDKLMKHTGWHDRLREWRKVRDRAMDAELAAFKLMLPLPLQAHWVPSQTPIVDDEIESLKAILAANEPDVQVVALSGKREIKDIAQEAEPGIEALYHALNPIELRLERYDAILGDAIAFEVLDRLPPGSEMAKYADREGLKSYAEKPEGEASDAQQAYRKAYEDSGDHDKAYNAVMEEARKEELRWRKRVLDMANVYWFSDERGVAEYCEASKQALAPAIDALEGYGVKRVGDRLVIEGYEDSALGDEQFEWDGGCNVNGVDTVDVTHIRTRTQTAILIEGLKDDQDGLLITFPSPFPKERHTCGAYITPGRVKKRGAVRDRYEPQVLPLIVVAQQLNIAKSVLQAQTYAEAARDVVQEQVDNPIAPLEPTLTTASKPVKDQKLPSQVRGKVVRIPSTGMDLGATVERLENELERLRSREFFSGTGTSGEPALHLARLQTAQLTRLVPIQTKCATTDKQQLEDILAAQAMADEPLYLHTPAPGTRGSGEEPEASEPLTLTPEMCRAPIQVVVEIGAETPESQYASEQVSEIAMEKGVYGMTEHRNRIGVKDPWQTVKDMAIDSIVFAALGTTKAPGSAITGVIAMVDQRAKELVDTLMPILTPPTPPPPPAGPGQEFMDQTMPEPNMTGPDNSLVAPPTQTVPEPAGVPANPGAMSTAV